MIPGEFSQKVNKYHIVFLKKSKIKNLFLEVYLHKLIISASHVLVQYTDTIKDSRALKGWANNKII